MSLAGTLGLFAMGAGIGHIGPRLPTLWMTRAAGFNRRFPPHPEPIPLSPYLTQRVLHKRVGALPHPIAAGRPPRTVVKRTGRSPADRRESKHPRPVLRRAFSRLGHAQHRLFRMRNGAFPDSSARFGAHSVRRLDGWNVEVADDRRVPDGGTSPRTRG